MVFFLFFNNLISIWISVHLQEPNLKGADFFIKAIVFQRNMCLEKTIFKWIDFEGIDFEMINFKEIDFQKTTVWWSCFLNESIFESKKLNAKEIHSRKNRFLEAMDFRRTWLPKWVFDSIKSHIHDKISNFLFLKIHYTKE